MRKEAWKRQMNHDLFLDLAYLVGWKTRLTTQMMQNRHTETKISSRCSYKLLKYMDKDGKPWQTTCYLS
jgi:hypothetical protein